MHRYRQILFTLGVLGLLPTQLFAFQDCGFESYRPEVISQVVHQSLDEAGVVFLGHQGATWGYSQPGTVLLKNNQILGRTNYQEDVHLGTAELTFADAAGRVYFVSKERTYPCGIGYPEGLCRAIDTDTELDKIPHAPPSFSLVLDPHGVVHYLRYGAPATRLDWKFQYLDAVRWLKKAAAHPTLVQLVQASSPKEQVFYALASDHLVSPYLDHLSVTFQGRLCHVTGSVPSDAAYGAVLERIRDLGYTVDPDLVIDERLAVTALALPSDELCFQ